MKGKLWHRAGSSEFTTGSAPDTFRDEMTGARAGDDVGGRGAHHQGLAEGPAGPPRAICHPSNAGVTLPTQTVPPQNSQLLIRVYVENSSSFPFSDSSGVEEKKKHFIPQHCYFGSVESRLFTRQQENNLPDTWRGHDGPDSSPSPGRNLEPFLMSLSWQ